MTNSFNGGFAQADTTKMHKDIIALRTKSTKLRQMGRIADNISRIKKELGNTKLLVVSKFRSVNEIKEAYEAGQTTFAENRVQALLERREALPQEIEWHLIGHLQTNKVKYIAPFITMIHSVESEKLLIEIDRRAAQYQRKIDLLLQLFISQDETKFGLSYEECDLLIAKIASQAFPNVQLRGLMGMATLTNDNQQIKSEFEALSKYFLNVKNGLMKHEKGFDTLSMGMSSDYKIAMDCGSTLVRIGSAVFE